ncbi:urease subunit alpha [Striga asiatica]|uniref:Urease subunit alpha n=1 Tax=Striga asiatica TaxID=4170 RepID=A0A5A7PP88_STRAF|nr:urease subunit alpha [Striga asiatica]
MREREVEMRILKLSVRNLHPSLLHQPIMLPHHRRPYHPILPPGHQIHRDINTPIAFPNIQRIAGPIRLHVRARPVIEHPEPSGPFHLRQVEGNPERHPRHVVHDPDPVGTVPTDHVAHEGLHEAADSWQVVEVSGKLVEEHSEESSRDREDGARVVVEASWGEEDEAGEAVRAAGHGVHEDGGTAEAVTDGAEVVGLGVGLGVGMGRAQLGGFDLVDFLDHRGHGPKKSTIKQYHISTKSAPHNSNFMISHHPDIKWIERNMDSNLNDATPTVSSPLNEMVLERLQPSRRMCNQKTTSCLSRFFRSLMESRSKYIIWGAKKQFQRKQNP